MTEMQSIDTGVKFPSRRMLVWARVWARVRARVRARARVRVWAIHARFFSRLQNNMYIKGKMGGKRNKISHVKANILQGKHAWQKMRNLGCNTGSQIVSFWVDI